MKRLIVAITGASGAVYGVRLLQMLRTVAEVESHLVLSQARGPDRDWPTWFTTRAT